MRQYLYKDLTIEIVDEPKYKINSIDNDFNYSTCIFGDEANEFPTSKHGIKIYKNEQLINSCIIVGSGGSTTIHKNSSILDKDQLLVCCCDTIFCLRVPNLELKWKRKVDQATCFQIFKLQNDYLVHGECLISKIDFYGNIIWEFGGTDIFVFLDNEEVIKIEDDCILLTDFSNTKYKIDFDGMLI